MTIPTGNSEGMGKKMGANVAIAIYTMSTGPRPFFLAEASDVVNVSQPPNPENEGWVNVATIPDLPIV